MQLSVDTIMKHKKPLSYIVMLFATIVANVVLLPSQGHAQWCSIVYPVDCPIYQTEYRYYDRWIPYDVYQYYDVPVYYDVIRYVDKTVERTKYYDDPTLCPTPVPCAKCPICVAGCPTCVCPPAP